MRSFRSLRRGDLYGRPFSVLYVGAGVLDSPLVFFRETGEGRPLPCVRQVLVVVVVVVVVLVAMSELAPVPMAMSLAAVL